MQVGHFANDLARPETADRPPFDRHLDKAGDDDTEQPVVITFPDQHHFIRHFAPDADTQHFPQLDVLEIGEGYIKRVFKEALGADIPTPFPRYTYNQVMERYGSDKPDLRIDLTCKNVSDLFAESEFEAFHGKTVKDGVYFVVVNARGADGKEYKIRKDVNVLTGYSGTGTNGND